jgi:hypothetical protein
MKGPNWEKIDAIAGIGGLALTCIGLPATLAILIVEWDTIGPWLQRFGMIGRILLIAGVIGFLAVIAGAVTYWQRARLRAWSRPKPRLKMTVRDITLYTDFEKHTRTRSAEARCTLLITNSGRAKATEMIGRVRLSFGKPWTGKTTYSAHRREPYTLYPGQTGHFLVCLPLDGLSENEWRKIYPDAHYLLVYSYSHDGDSEEHHCEHRGSLSKADFTARDDPAQWVREAGYPKSIGC